MSNIKHLPDILKVCSVLPALIVMPAVGAEYTSGDIESYAYTVKAGDSLLVTEGVSNAENGVFHNYGTLTINDGLVFADNNTGSPTKAGFGAVMHIRNNGETTNTIIGNNVVFSGGTALYEGSDTLEPGMGGAIFSWSDGPLDGVSFIEMGDNVVFRNNTAVDGSAIYTYGHNTIIVGDNFLMENNSATGGNGAFMVNGYDARGSDFVNTVTIGKNATFQNNTAVYRAGAFYVGGDTNDKAIFGDGASFIKNSSSYGGAVAGFGVFEFGDVTFDSNFAFDAWNHVFKDVEGTKESDYTNYVGNGGAVLNRGNMVINGTAKFIDNRAEGNGGAIYNGATVEFNDEATFTNNYTDGLGGAIYNGGTGATVDLSDAVAVFNENKSIVDGGAIYNDANAVLKIGDAKFINNRASYDSWDSAGYGGAIFALGDLDIVSEKANGVIFSNNAAFSGGAVYGSKNSDIGMNIENALFDGNHAIADAGALGIFNNAMSKVTGTVFRNNTVAVSVDNLIVQDDIKEADGGGAIQLGGTASAELVDNHFVGNESGVRGGAISARHGKDYELNVSKSSFTKNIAGTNGGAIAHVFAGELNVENTNFYSNIAGKSGGAIYNGADWNFGGKPEAVLSTGDGIVNISGENMFSGNIATEFGGAIFNGEKGTLNMAGTNTFVNNTADGGANDIHNDGAFNILADANVTIGGGITGSGTLTLAKDATLDIGTAAIIQDAININGTVVASVVSDRSYGRFVTENMNFADDAVLRLNIGAVGTYNILAGKVIGMENIIVGDTYNAISTSAGIVIETKSVAEIAEKTGLTSEVAGTVVNLANATDRNIQKLSLKMQEALNSGDVAAVEKETTKLNPEDKPVTRSVAMATQNQVLSVATNRMGAGVGRAGGDRVQSSGFWAQGLYNKSSFADEFEGTSNGFAVGTDMTIDRKYTLGAGFAYSNTDIDANGRETAIDNTTLFVYGQYKPNNWFLNGIVSYTMGEYDENVDPFGVTVNSVYDVNSYGAQVMTGYDFAFGFTPMAGVRYLHVEQDAYNNGINSISAQESDYMSGVAGLKYAVDVATNSGLRLRPELRAAATYDFVSDDSIATVTMANIENSYTVDGQSLSQIGGEFGVGLTALYNGVQLSVNYDVTVHEDYTSHTGMIKFRGQF